MNVGLTSSARCLKSSITSDVSMLLEYWFEINFGLYFVKDFVLYRNDLAFLPAKCILCTHPATPKIALHF